MQSEEAERFYLEQNRNMTFEADQLLPVSTPDNFIWMMLLQVQKFMLLNNFLNIQALSLISALVTRENEYG